MISTTFFQSLSSSEPLSLQSFDSCIFSTNLLYSSNVSNSSYPCNHHPVQVAVPLYFMHYTFENGFFACQIRFMIFLRKSSYSTHPLFCADLSCSSNCDKHPEPMNPNPDFQLFWKLFITHKILYNPIQCDLHLGLLCSRLQFGILLLNSLIASETSSSVTSSLIFLISTPCILLFQLQDKTATVIVISKSWFFPIFLNSILDFQWVLYRAFLMLLGYSTVNKSHCIVRQYISSPYFFLIYAPRCLYLF